ncbi:MAG TPA: UDP-N-acetylmuramoyl-tripeptide--D-alanyl-D-alanine ligase [Solirubrobacterales bacterium]|nr:UDP-N-acetylmuramoyl-tripeptide--D-alanyl-D-alanine ligase [Solirubrobacterales bacterium]
MIDLPPERIADAAGLEILREGPPGRPERAVTDSREVSQGDLFFGLPGQRADGGEFAPGVLEDGAWGIVALPQHARAAMREGRFGWVYSSQDPLASLQALAREWRWELEPRVVGITGSTGKTSVKDIAKSLLPFRTHASPENYNTEIGLPLTILGAPPDTEVLVLEMAMRGMGQIAELCEIAEPEIGVITNIGPVHLELLGTLEAIAEAKAEILSGIGPDGQAIVPVDAEALEPHLADDVNVLTFGPGGDVMALDTKTSSRTADVKVATPVGEQRFVLPFAERYNVQNALAAIAIGVALGADLGAMARRAPDITFSRLRGEHLALPGKITLLNDCYNANPISMHAALQSLSEMPAPGRRVAVLGGMAELGPDAATFHREIGSHARGLGISPVIGVGEMARDYAPDEWAPDPASAAELADGLITEGDTILVKGSRSVGLEHFTDELIGRRGRA